MTYHRVLTRVTRRMSLVEQELLTLTEHLNSSPVFSGVRVVRSFVFCVVYIVVCSFVLFLLVIVLSVILRFTDSDYPFGILQLFSLFRSIWIHLRFWWGSCCSVVSFLCNVMSTTDSLLSSWSLFCLSFESRLHFFLIMLNLKHMQKMYTRIILSIYWYLFRHLLM